MPGIAGAICRLIRMHGAALFRASGAVCRASMVVAMMLALLTPMSARAHHSNPHLTGGPGHPLPVRSGGASLSAAQGIPARLYYYGGRVVSNLQVVQVLWGNGNYLSTVSSVTTPSIATFYQGVLNSAYVEWLTEYNTDIPATGGGPGTNQSIGHGSFVGQYTITPSSQNNGGTISDSQIQSELTAQILAGHLPVFWFSGNVTRV